MNSVDLANHCHRCWCGNALLVPFRAVLLHVMINGRLFVITFLSHHLPSCSGAFYLWLLWHISLFLSCSILQSKARVWGVDVLVCEDSRYLLKYWFVMAIPSCGGAHLHDMFKSCMLRRYQDFRLGCIFFLFLFSLVLSINSPNATTLHSCCIWEGVLGYIYVSRVV